MVGEDERWGISSNINVLKYVLTNFAMWGSALSYCKRALWVLPLYCSSLPFITWLKRVQCVYYRWFVVGLFRSSCSWSISLNRLHQLHGIDLQSGDSCNLSTWINDQSIPRLFASGDIAMDLLFLLHSQCEAERSSSLSCPFFSCVLHVFPCSFVGIASQQIRIQTRQQTVTAAVMISQVVVMTCPYSCCSLNPKIRRQTWLLVLLHKVWQGDPARSSGCWLWPSQDCTVGVWIKQF